MGIVGKQMKNADFPHLVTTTARCIKEILNQPHKHYAEKNESVLQIDILFETSTYLGTLIRKEKDDFISFLFQTSIANDPSWIIVRKYERSDDYCIYTISDQPNLLKYLKEKEDSWIGAELQSALFQESSFTYCKEKEKKRFFASDLKKFLKSMLW